MIPLHHDASWWSFVEQVATDSSNAKKQIDKNSVAQLCSDSGVLRRFEYFVTRNFQTFLQIQFSKFNTDCLSNAANVTTVYRTASNLNPVRTRTRRIILKIVFPELDKPRKAAFVMIFRALFLSCSLENHDSASEIGNPRQSNVHDFYSTSIHLQKLLTFQKT